MTMKRSVVTAAILGAAAFSGSAMAGMSGNVGVVSNYVFRGLSQDLFGLGTEPAVQGGLDYSDDSGLYAGLWGSNIGWGPGGNETDVYAGFSGEASGVGYDVGAIYYFYGEEHEYGFTPFADSANTYEVYASGSVAGLTLAVNYSPNFFGLNEANGDNMSSWYFNLAYEYGLSDTLSASAAVGYTKLSDDNALMDSKGDPTDDYIDYNVSLSKDVGDGLSATFSVIGTNLTNPATGNSDAPKYVIGMNKSFDL